MFNFYFFIISIIIIINISINIIIIIIIVIIVIVIIGLPKGPLSDDLLFFWPSEATHVGDVNGSINNKLLALRGVPGYPSKTAPWVRLVCWNNNNLQSSRDPN